MIAYTTAFLAAANLLALAHAAPAQPVCFAVTTVITGSPIWVPRADPTTSAGWGAWPSKDSPSVSTTTTVKTGASPTGKPTDKTTWTTDKTTWTATTSTGGAFYPITSSSVPLTTITVTPTIDVPTTSTPITSTTAPAPPPAAPTCPYTDKATFTADPSGSCGCEFSVSCNVHAPYTADTKFWERNSGEIIESLEECQQICNDNSQCQAAIWVIRDGAPSSEYKRCYQTQNLPAGSEDGYGQLSFKGACSSSCSSSYIN